MNLQMRQVFFSLLSEAMLTLVINVSTHSSLLSSSFEENSAKSTLF
jgi:hypothetical protein